MFFINLLVTILAAYFVKQEYDRDRIGWAILWAMLLGWDLHTLLSLL